MRPCDLAHRAGQELLIDLAPFLGLLDLRHLPDLCFGHSRKGIRHSREGLGDVFEVREGGFEGGFEGGLFAFARHRRTDDLAMKMKEKEKKKVPWRT